MQCVADRKTFTKFMSNVKIQAGTAVCIVYLQAVIDLCLISKVRPADTSRKCGAVVSSLPCYAIRLFI